MAARFLIAKYVPDLRRMEPRNIGVVVWSNGRTLARFVGERPDAPSRVSPPQYLHVASRNAYRQWIGYWRTVIERKELSSAGKMIAHDEPEFVKALAAQSKQQYKLVEGGEFLKQISDDELPEVVDELYDELVAVDREPSERERADASRDLKRACKQAIAESGIAENNRDFWDGFDWICHVDGKSLPFHFDYAIHREKPVAIMRRVSFWKPEMAYSTAFEFRAMMSEYSIPRQNCAALVYPTAADMRKSELLEVWKLLDSIGVVLDMRDIRSASSAFMRMMAV